YFKEIHCMSRENIVPPGVNETTKVFYYLNDEPTPYVEIIHVGAESVTLGHFKRSFTRKGFKYYGKLLDPDIEREVKVELIGDETKLTRNGENGLFELFLLSTGTQNGGGGGTLQRKTNGTLTRRVGKERNDRDIYNTHRVHSDDYDSSSRQDTLMSRRAGEILAESITSASENLYEYDDSRQYNAVMGDEASRIDGPRRRKARKNRVRKSYVPSTVGSQPESRYGGIPGTSLSLPRILEVNLQIGPNDLLGISVVSVEGSILISDVFPVGVVARDGRIDVGDQIVQVNTRSFENLSDQQAIMILRKVAAAKKPLTLYVAKRTMSTAESDPLCTLASETLPLDISLWVENAVHCTERQRFGVDGSVDGTILSEGVGRAASICTEDEEEERMLYVQRRNGMGIRERGLEQPPIHLHSAPPPRGNYSEGSGYTERLSTRINPHSLINIISQPNSGLTVKNRKWLKIPVPQSFIGVELVDWLVQNVEDLGERKEARKYATHLLEKGLIKHVVNKRDFTEKCYYVFNEGIMSSCSRKGDSIGETSGGREGNTEVTYVEGVDSPSRNRLPPIHDNTWPFSPITLVHNRGIGHRAECESDYASMVGSSFPVRQHPPPNTPLAPSQFDDISS
ncbi:mig-5, partial [Pristionchus pacificus]